MEKKHISNTLSAIWHQQSLPYAEWRRPKKVSEMTEEEQQEEVIRRLKTPRRTANDFEAEITDALVAQIQIEIDNEILNSLKNIK